MFAFIAPILLFIAFLLLLLVTLSIPIIKTIYLFTLSTNVDGGLLNFNADASGSVKFGVWGYCTSAVDVAVAGIKHSTAAASCTKPHLGYTFDSTVATFLDVQGFTDVISKVTTASMVLHPIACGLTFLVFLVSLFMLHRGSNGTSRLPSLITLVLGTLAAVLTTIIFLIDVIFIAIVRKRIENDTDNEVHLGWGNAVWMVLGATIALWLALLGACAGICACGGRHRKRHETY
ncbi:pali-domain-containing protein [Mycena floridula]|nr:pali-domain-containing protein [Mycena floridula]